MILEDVTDELLSFRFVVTADPLPSRAAMLLDGLAELMGRHNMIDSHQLMACLGWQPATEPMACVGRHDVLLGTTNASQYIYILALAKSSPCR